MSTATQNLLEAVLALSPADRALIANAVLESLDPVDPEIERELLQEVRDRIAAYEAGELETITEEEFFAESGQ